MKHHFAAVFFLCLFFSPHVGTGAGQRIDGALPGRDGAGDQPGGGRVTGSLGAGFDSFQEKYSIVDKDTLDNITEFRTRLTLGYVAGTFLKDFFHVEGRTVLGNDSYETTGGFKLAKRLRADRYFGIGIDGEIIRRAFRKNSSYEYANNYTRYYFRAYLKKALGDVVSLRLSERFENQDFDERTEFDYDYQRNSVSLTGEFDWGISTCLDAGLTFTAKSVPDSTGIGYASLTPTVEFRHDGGTGRRFLLFSTFEHRGYRDENIRSSYRALFAVSSIRWPISGPCAVSLTNDVEYYDYKENSDVYFDYVENKSALLFNYDRAWSMRFGIGPAYGFFTSDFSREDEYNEYGVKCTLEYNRGTRAWISMDYENGKRSYSAYPGARMESIFSDYAYNRVSFFSNLKLWNGLSLSGLLDYQPEDHEREGDDASATLFSFSVTYIF